VLGEAIHTTSILGLFIIVAGLVVTGRPATAERDASAAHQ
jgi:hypothetical protein